MTAYQESAVRWAVAEAITAAYEAGRWFSHRSL
jgi:hypothetical protein